MSPVYTFYVAGVGGTGSLLARDLPQLLIGTHHRMVLIDGDVVEKKNLKRQSFQEQDIGQNKAIAMARKINTFYDIDCLAMDCYLTDRELSKRIDRDGALPVIIGCVDNDNTRMILEKTFKEQEDGIYIDAANSEYSGNVYTVCMCESKQYGKLRSEVYMLDNDINPAEKSCQAQAMAGNLQYFITNDRMATCILEHCFNLISDEPLLIGVTEIDRFKEIHFAAHQH